MFFKRFRLAPDPTSPKGYRIEPDREFNRANAIAGALFGICLALMGPMVGIAVFCLCMLAKQK